MKRLIISRLNSNPYDTGLNKIIEQWESGQSIIVVPPEYVVEVVEDGRNEAAIWLDQEIEKRKAAVEEKNLKFEGCITWKCPRCGYTFYNQDETASIICPNCKTKTRREHEDRQSKD